MSLEDFSLEVADVGTIECTVPSPVLNAQPSSSGSESLSHIALGVSSLYSVLKVTL